MYRTLLLVALFTFLVPVARKMLLLGAAFFFFCKMKVLSKYRIYVLPHGDGQALAEARSGAINFLIDIALLLWINHLGWIPAAPNTIMNIVGTYACMFVWYEIWFYLAHRACHSKALYFIHAQHHLSRVTTPFAAFSFSIMERSILNLGAIGFAIVYSHLLPFSVAGFVLYCISNNAMNVLLHCNVEIFPAGFARNPVLGWIFTPTFHAMHHARYLRHYGLFTTIPDRMFNTLWPDYAAVQERVARGEGLTAFHEKVTVGEGKPVATGGEPRGVLAYPVSE